MNKIRKAVVGAAAGALATVPMTGAFLAARRAGLLDEVPPHKAIRSVTSGPGEPRLTIISAIAHVAVGGGAGALYGLLVPARTHGVLSGALFGLGVWVVGYEFVMPAATAIAPAHRDRRDRAATILVAHIIFGATMGLITARGQRQMNAR